VTTTAQYGVYSTTEYDDVAMFYASAAVIIGVAGCVALITWALLANRRK
jgi:hypothetical protein